MVAAAVAVLELICVCAGRESHQLVAETDRKNRDAACVEFADLGDHASALLRIAGAVGEHDAVRIIRKDIHCRRKRRVDRDIASSGCQGSGNVSLRAVVHESDFEVPSVRADSVELLHKGRLFLMLRTASRDRRPVDKSVLVRNARGRSDGAFILRIPVLFFREPVRIEHRTSGDRGIVSKR